MKSTDERKAAHAALRRRFQKSLQARMEKDRQERLAAAKMRRPRYDEIYFKGFKGVEWLDSL
jgi:hypothetical protein